MKVRIHALAALASIYANACSGTGPTPADEPDCSGYEDEIDQPPIDVIIRNASANPIYLGTTATGCVGTIELFLSAGGDNLSWRRDGSCTATCDQLQDGRAACNDICAMPPLIYLAPGGTHTEQWVGTIAEPRTMPRSCFFSSDDTTCSQVVEATTGGVYTFTAHAWSSIGDCTNDPLRCDCTPGSEGSCRLDGFDLTPTGATMEASASLTYPSDRTVEVVFN